MYAALDPLLSRPIAVKTLHVDAAARRAHALESQLLAEARAAAGLSHPNIVTVYDAGLAEEGVYIAMERLQGKDLRHLLADGWRPEPVQAARIAKRIADALAYAHGNGVVHCDIKPANIFMVGRTQPKVLDFGIARVTRQRATTARDGRSRVDTGASEPPAELGSPYYVAPGTIARRAAGRACDVYGVGVVLYEMLTGRRAFDGDTLDAIRQAVLEATCRRRTAEPPCQAALSDIVARAMARKIRRNASARRASCRARCALAQEETSDLAAAPPASAPTAPGPAAAAWAWRWPRRSGCWGRRGWRTAAPAPARRGRPRRRRRARGAPSPRATRWPAPPPRRPLAAPRPAPPRAGASPRRSRRRQRARAARVARRTQAPRTPSRRARRRSRRRRAARPGIVQLAVSPWGQVEIDGGAVGTTPPLSADAAGRHAPDRRAQRRLPALRRHVTVSDEKPVTLRHRFGT